jgi:hypothetical protein
MRLTTQHPEHTWRENVMREVHKAETLIPTVSPWSPHSPSKTAVERAKALVNAIERDDLDVPITSTSPEGTICLEWRRPDRKLIFSVSDDGVIEFFGRSPSKPSGFEGEIKSHLDRVNEIVRMFAD